MRQVTEIGVCRCEEELITGRYKGIRSRYEQWAQIDGN